MATAEVHTKNQKNEANFIITDLWWGCGSTMVSHLSSVVLAISLLFVTVFGRTLQTYDLHHTSLQLDSSSTTNYSDVMGLITLTNQFPQLIEAQWPLINMDPCYPEKLTWIDCTSGDVRRVTALYLGNRYMYGLLPDFSPMDALETIDLQQNFLIGSIPAFLGTFPNLTYLNLASNAFTGPLPSSLSNNKKIKLDVSGDPGVCASSNSNCSPPADTQNPLNPFPTGGGDSIGIPSGGANSIGIPSGGASGGSFDVPDTSKSRRKRSKVPTIVGATVPPGLIATVGGGIFAICRRHKRNATAANAAAADAVPAAPVGGA